MEEQGPAGGAERQVAKLVEDQEIGVGEPRRDLAGFALKLLLLESVDEFDGGEEPDALAVMLDGLDANRRGEMRLPHSGPPTRTTLWASSRNSHRWSWRNSALLNTLLAKSKPVRSR